MGSVPVSSSMSSQTVLTGGLGISGESPRSCLQRLQILFLGAVGEESEVPYAHESIWKDMEQKTPDELVCFKCHEFPRVIVFAIFVGECDPAVVDVDDAVVGYGDSMRIAPEIVENLLRAGKRLFGIDDPVFFPQFLQKPGESLAVCEVSSSSVEDDLALGICLL